MFGAVFVFALIIYGIIQMIKNVKEDLRDRTLYKDTKSNTYLSYDGSRRDLDTGKQRFIYYQNGDRYMKGEDIEEINLSQLDRDEAYKQAKINHPIEQTVAFYSKEPTNTEHRGKRYKDLKTGEIYVVREDKNSNLFYVTLNNQVIRLEDTDKKYKKRYGIYDEQKEKELVFTFQQEIDRASLDSFWKDPTMIYHKKGRRL